MRRILTTLAVAAGLAGLAAAPSGAASSKPFTSFGPVTAYNGANQYARTHLGADARTKIVVECMRARRLSASPISRSPHWVCAVDTFAGIDTPIAHAYVGVLRKGGQFVFRPYDLVQVDR